jgi:hypothetical protein
MGSDTLVQQPPAAVSTAVSNRRLAAERQLAGDRIRLAYSVMARRRVRRLGRRATVGGRRLS